MRTSLLLGALISVLALSACARTVGPAGDGGGDTGVDVSPIRRDVMALPLGAQCYPARPPRVPGGPSCGNDAGCFSGQENYIEIDSLQCQSTRCAVYRWDEARQPEQADRAFCSCRCAGQGLPGPFCTCPSGFSCTQIFSFGDPSFRGDYCVPDRFLR